MNESSTRAVIDVRGVHTRFGETVVHQGVDLEVSEGEIFAIAGGSGSGKSVLLREIIMLHEPDAGTIRLFGQDVTHLRPEAKLPIRRRIGVLFQQGALFSSLNVMENICFTIREHTDVTLGLAREIAALKIALVGLKPDDAFKYPAELSGGMQKRAALARALALDPDILFLDEPTSGLDPLSAGAFDDLVLRLKAGLGLTMMIITHDLDSMWRVTDRVAVLGRGRVLSVGDMRELSRVEDPLVRAYFEGPRARAAQAERTD